MRFTLNSTRNPNDKRTVQIKTKNLTVNIDELFHMLILECKNIKTDLVLEGVDSIIYNFRKTITSSYIDTSDCIKNKKCTINPQNKDDKCFQYAAAIALNHKKINNHPERIPKIKPFINQYNWDNLNFPSQQQDYEKFETNNKSIALNVLHIPHNTKDIKHFYVKKNKCFKEFRTKLRFEAHKKECC